MANKVNVGARFEYVLFVGIKRVHEEEAYVKVTRGEYDRLLKSYEAGIYEDMREDEAIADVVARFVKEAEDCEGEIKLLEYPEAIKDGWPFDRALNPKSYAEPLPPEETYTGPDGEEYKDVFEYADKMEEKYMARLAGTEEEETERYEKIEELGKWMAARGFDYGAGECGLTDDSGYVVEVVDAGWPYGIYGQMGFTKPVCVQFYHTTDEVIELARKNNYEVFTSIEEFKDFITKNCIRR